MSNIQNHWSGDKTHDFAKDRRVCDAATDTVGPWETDGDGRVTHDCGFVVDCVIGTYPNGDRKPDRFYRARANFIARARTRWPAALDRIEELGIHLRDAEMDARVKKARIAELERERDASQLEAADAIVRCTAAEARVGELAEENTRLRARPTEDAYEAVCAVLAKYQAMFDGGSADENAEKLAGMRGRITELEAENERLREERMELEQAHDEEIDEWKAAAGLNISGDPGDVTPADVTRLVQQYDAVAVAAQNLLKPDSRGGYRAVIRTERRRAALVAALAALPREE